MARILRASIAVLTLAASAAACTALMPTSSLRGGDDASADGGAADGPVEGAPPDGGVEAGDGGRWCASLTTARVLCDDFDDMGPFSLWTESYLRANGSVTRDTAAYRSAPLSFLSLIPSATTAGSAALRTFGAAPVSSMHVEYDMRIDVRDTQTAYAEVNYLRMTTGQGSETTAWDAYMQVNGTDACRYVTESHVLGGNPVQHFVTLAGNPRFTNWTRVVVDVDLASSPRTFAVSIDGLAAAKQVLEDNLYPSGPPRVDVGIGYTASPSAEWKIRYDNVIVDWK